MDVTAATVELAALEHPGGDPAVVALHGLASSAHWWDLVAARLAQRLLAPDQRGHGRSPRPADGYDLDTVAGDVVALMDRHRITGAVVAGHSWGASVALRLAALAPGLVAGLVLVDGGLTDLRASFGGEWSRAEAALRPPDMVGIARERLLRAASGTLAEGSDAATAGAILLSLFEPVDPDDAQRGMRPRLRLEPHMAIARSLFDADPAALLIATAVPITALVATEGPEPFRAAREAGAAAAEALLGDRLRVEWVEGGHDLPVQRPDAVAAAIREMAGRI